MIYFFLFVLGTIIGSFLNVVSLRWDNKNVGGRSVCLNCCNTLRWYELMPVLSFIIQRGKCRTCNAEISYQYPIVEILTGLVFATIFNFQFSILQNLLFLTIFCVYIVIVIYDIHHKIIPDELVYTAIFLSLFIPLFFIHYSTLDWLAGPVIFFFFAAIWFFSRGRAMGLGDAKLGLSIGLLLGATQGFSAIILAFWLGAAVSLIYLFFNKNLTMKSEVPFAPFIIASAWLSLVFDLNIFYAMLL